MPRQFESPLVLVLAVAASVSLALRELIDATIIRVIVLGSALIGFVQEHRAAHAVAAPERWLALRARVLRDGAETLVPANHVVPGAIVLLAADNLVPADGVENLQTSPGLVSPPVWFRRLPLPDSSTAA